MVLGAIYMSDRYFIRKNGQIVRLNDKYSYVFEDNKKFLSLSFDNIFQIKKIEMDIEISDLLYVYVLASNGCILKFPIKIQETDILKTPDDYLNSFSYFKVAYDVKTNEELLVRSDELVYEVFKMKAGIEIQIGYQLYKKNKVYIVTKIDERYDTCRFVEFASGEVNHGWISHLDDIFDFYRPPIVWTGLDNSSGVV